MVTLEDVTSSVLGGLTQLKEKQLLEIAALCDLPAGKLQKVKSIKRTLWSSTVGNIIFERGRIRREGRWGNAEMPTSES